MRDFWVIFIILTKKISVKNIFLSYPNNIKIVKYFDIKTPK